MRGARLVMLRTIVTLTTLLAVVLLPAVATAGDGSDVGRCHLVAQDLDYSHYVCVDPSDPGCAVYFLTTSGSYSSKRCYGVFEDPPFVVAAPEERCIPTSGGLDYPSWLCVDPGNPRCAVYTVTTSDWGVKKTCIPGV